MFWELYEWFVIIFCLVVLGYYIIKIYKEIKEKYF